MKLNFAVPTCAVPCIAMIVTQSGWLKTEKSRTTGAKNASFGNSHESQEGFTLATVTLYTQEGIPEALTCSGINGSYILLKGDPWEMMPFTLSLLAYFGLVLLNSPDFGVT
jgi:hypothetical protein